MRILLISHTCQSQAEGQPRAKYLSGLDQVELKVLVPERWNHYGTLRTPEYPGPEVSYSYEAGKVAWPWAGPAQFYLHWYPGLFRVLKRFQPDIIDLWEEPWSLVSAQVCMLRNRYFPEMRIISETEQNIEKQLPQPFEWFRNYTLRNADYAVGRSLEAIEVIRKKGYRGPAEVVPNAVDTNIFRPLNSRKCRNDLNLDGFVVGYIGRMVEEKGLVDLLEALNTCPPDVRLLLVGSGPLLPELKCRAAAMGRLNQIHFLPPKGHHELATVINAMDVLALVSHTTPRWKEQFGRVIIEAHACGVPVIGSNTGAIPDVLGLGGEIVPERDPASLSAAIRKLHDHRGRSKKLGYVGLHQVERRYTWTSVASQMRRIYLQTSRQERRFGAVYA